MRKTALTALIAATVLLSACGGDDEPADESTTAEQTGGDTAETTPPADEPTEEAGDVDPAAALLTAEDLPSGVQIVPLDLGEVSGSLDSLESLLEGIAYEPADCAGNDDDPLMREGADGAAITAVQDADVLVNAVYSGASADDIAAVGDYYERCGEISVTGDAGGQPLDMTVSSQVVDAPDVDADEVIAIETVTTGSGIPEIPMRTIYMVDGDYGVYVSGNTTSVLFDFDALAATALEKLRAARG